MPASKFYQLKDRCVFVEVAPPPPGEPPEPVPLTQIIDMTGSKARYLEVDSISAFILRFLQQRVPENLIKQLLISEYGVGTDADGIFQNFLTVYKDTEKVVVEVNAQANKTPGHCHIISTGDFNKLEMNFRVNFIGISRVVFPIT